MNPNCEALLKLPKVKFIILLVQKKLSYMKWNDGDDDDHYKSNTNNNNSIMSSQEIPRVHFPQ